MKNTFGNNLTITIFGESHGEAIGCVLDGVAPGIKLNIEYIKSCLAKRASRSDISTPRCEPDEPIFLSGIKDCYTEGTPIAIIIKNTNTKSGHYSRLYDTPRPSHADYPASVKYHGYEDKAGGGHFSGRLTASIVAAGALIRSALLDQGIKIGTHIKSLHGIDDEPFNYSEETIDALFSRDFPTISEPSGEEMKKEIKAAAARHDSVGGILECCILGLPAGVGEPWFDTLDGMLSHAMLSIPAVKGIEFGAGFSMADMYGTEANDQYILKDGKIATSSNNNGGILGGISTGMPIVFSLAIKPTPSISAPQKTVNTATMTPCDIQISGRHDPAIIHRACAVVDAMAALTVADMLTGRYGTDFLKTGSK